MDDPSTFYTVIRSRRPFTAGAAPTDPNFANVVVLAINDSQADTTTAFDDQSTYNRTLTANGNAQYDTAFAPAGLTSSGLFDGTGDSVSYADAAELAFGTSNFCVEGFFRIAFDSTARCLWTNAGSTGTQLSMGLLCRSATSNIAAFASSDGATPDIINLVNFGATYSDNTWTHFAFYRVGTSWYGAIGGTTVLLTTSAAAVFNTTDASYIGADPGTASGAAAWLGNIAPFRIYIGSSPYGASNFTPPSLPFLTS